MWAKLKHPVIGAVLCTIAFWVALMWTRYPETQFFSLREPLLWSINKGLLRNQDELQLGAFLFRYSISLLGVCTLFLAVRLVAKRSS